MLSTCIRHPERQPLTQIKAWQVYATDGNYCAAALLSFFEYWHNYKLDEKAVATEKVILAERNGVKLEVDTDLLQFHTEAQLSAGLLGLYKETAIGEATKLLESKGFISIHRNPNTKYKFDNTHYYLFHPEKVQKYIDTEYPQNYGKFDSNDLVTRFKKKRKKQETPIPEVNNDSPSINNDSPEVKTAGTITKITSEITTETTSNTWSSQSSDLKLQNDSQVNSPELRGECLDYVWVDDATDWKNYPEEFPAKSSQEMVLRKKPETLTDPAPKRNKTVSKREKISLQAKNPEFIKFFENLRSKYHLYSGNKYLNHFGTHKEQFYKTLAYRVASSHITTERIELAFQEMTERKDFSVIQFLEKLECSTYDTRKLLTDFIWIMTDGKVAAPTAEKKGAKDLSEWLEDRKTTLTEIEDCFFWMPQSGRSYKLSLISMKSALS